MKSKQTCPKSVRPLNTSSSIHRTPKQRVRCSLCHSLLKPSTTHRFVLSGKSIQEKLDENSTYADCCRRYFDENYQNDQSQMLCPTCCHDLQQIHSFYSGADRLIQKLKRTWNKTKRLNRNSTKRLTKLPHSLSFPMLDEKSSVQIKQEKTNDEPRSIGTYPNRIEEEQPFDLSSSSFTNRTRSIKTKFTEGANNGFLINSKPVNESQKKRKATHMMSHFASSQLPQTNNPVVNGTKSYASPSSMINASTPFQFAHAQLMIESPSPLSYSPKEHLTNSRRSSSSSEKIPSTIPFGVSLEDEQSMSPGTNDEESSSMNDPKSSRLSRRQYDFLVKLPDQSSLNAFIETSSAESGSRWTWRRTSANSRGYKVYYVCNFSMRRHYHPCPAAMYALFHPDSSISIYSCGQHQHIPKDRLPVSITDATKEEIFRCLQNGMGTTEIREHLVRLQLPFGDTRKLNNFIKYHKELLRFGTVTNVRIGGTAYRQPQCWAIRRQNVASSPAAVTSNDEKKSS